MKKQITVILVSMMILFSSCGSFNNITNTLVIKKPFNGIQIYNKLLPSIVTIEGKSKYVKGNYVLFGTGFILSKDGHIGTCKHVTDVILKNSAFTDIYIRTSTGIRYKADLVGIVTENDFALLKTELIGGQPITMAKSVAIGETVYVIGNPLRYENTITSGILSSIRYNMKAIGITFDRLLQTDASINCGNSGGVLVNQTGEFMGMVSFMITNVGDDTGLNFAVAYDEIEESFNKLK